MIDKYSPMFFGRAFSASFLKSVSQVNPPQSDNRNTDMCSPLHHISHSTLTSWTEKRRGFTSTATSQEELKIKLVKSLRGRESDFALRDSA